MEQIFMLLASIFAGLCAASVVLLVAEMVSAIDVEKAQFGEDARHIPVFFRPRERVRSGRDVVAVLGEPVDGAHGVHLALAAVLADDHLVAVRVLDGAEVGGDDDVVPLRDPVADARDEPGREAPVGRAVRALHVLDVVVRDLQ